MKNIFGVLFLIVLMFMLTACGKSTADRWQEQYDLGEKYLLEEDYEAAIVAFTAAIEIDSKEIQAYTGLVQAYMETQNQAFAASTVDDAIDIMEMTEVIYSEERLDSFINVAVEAYESISDIDRQYNFWMSLIELVEEDSRETLREKGAVALSQIGQTYLEQKDYEQAEIAFNKAIELEPLITDYYMQLANVLFAQGKYEDGINILENGYELIGDESLNDRILEAQEEQNQQRLSELEEELIRSVDQMNIQLTVDDVELGVTETEVAVAAYENRIGAKIGYYAGRKFYVSAYYGKNGDPIAEGYEEGDVDFKFDTLYIGRTTVNSIDIENSDFLCLGSLRVGDDFVDVLKLYGVSEAYESYANSINIKTENGRSLTIGYTTDGDEVFWYNDETVYVEIYGKNGKIYRISLARKY